MVLRRFGGRLAALVQDVREITLYALEEAHQLSVGPLDGAHQLAAQGGSGWEVSQGLQLIGAQNLAVHDARLQGEGRNDAGEGLQGLGHCHRSSAV